MRVCDTVRKWRVLQVVSSSATSGAERHLVLLSRTLQQRGHHVVTVCPPDNWLPQELQRAGVRTLPLPMHGFGSLMTLRRLAQVVREQQIDIIHTHLTRAAYYGLLLGLLMRKPVVSTVHVFTSDPAYRWLSRRGNPLIAVSEAVRNWLVGHGARASEVHTVYNATDFVSLNGAKVNAPADVRSEFRMPCSGKLVGVFAKVTAIKGQDLLLEALPQVLRLHPDVYVLFVGNAEGDFARRIQQHAKDLGVHQRVVFTGLRADVARLMQAVDIVVLPSRMEACPLVVLEAMALGKPVVATRVGGLPELVRHGETGILADLSAASLAHALDELLASADLRGRLGHAARTLARQQYAPERMARHVEAVYARVLAG